MRTLRRSAGYSLAGMAGLLGIPAAQLSAVERGSEAPLDRRQIEKIAALTEGDPRLLTAAADGVLRNEFRSQWGLR